MLCSCHLGRGRSCLVYQGSHVLRKHFWCYHFNSLRSFPHDVLGSLACFFPRNGFFFRLAKWNAENDWPKVMLSHWGIRGSVVFDVMICLVFFESLEMWKKIGKNKQSLGKPCVLLLSCPFFLIKFCIVFLFKPCWTLIFERSSKWAGSSIGAQSQILIVHITNKPLIPDRSKAQSFSIRRVLKWHRAIFFRQKSRSAFV